jgi:hypothetical protein
MKSAISVFVAVLTLAWGIWYEQQHPLTQAKAATRPAATSTAVLAAVAAAAQETPFRPAPRTKTAACVASGGLPDPACTPGAIFANATSGAVCIQGYSKTVRAVTPTTKKKVYAEYGLAYPQQRGAYEADHFIPLELGGSNDIGNLFPEAATPTPGFHEKDLVENYLHNEVCAGEMPLSAAQRSIATNWLDVWHSLTPEQVAALKAQYASY